MSMRTPAWVLNACICTPMVITASRDGTHDLVMRGSRELMELRMSRGHQSGTWSVEKVNMLATVTPVDATLIAGHMTFQTFRGLIKFARPFVFIFHLVLNFCSTSKNAPSVDHHI